MTAATGKPAWRARLLASRRGASPAERAAADAALCSWVTALTGTVGAYWAVGAEPGRGVPAALAAGGCRVLLPVVRAAGPLAWGEYHGDAALRAGPHGLREPVPAPGLTAADTDVVLLPALGVSRDGVRLGRGGGHYDRTLAGCAPRPRLVAVVRDDELIDELPVEPHDVLVDEALTPGRGFVTLRR